MKSVKSTEIDYLYKIFKPQLGEDCKLIFDGHISELDDFL